MTNRITKLNSNIQETVIKENQTSFALKVEEQKTNYFLDKILDKVIIGDYLKVMKKLSSEFVDRAFIDPPYFLQLPPKKLLRWTGSVLNGMNDQWYMFKYLDDQDNFTKNYLTEIKKLIKPNTTIWIIIWAYHNIYRIGKIILDLRFWILNDVIWFKTNPMPKLLGVRFTNVIKTLLWAVKENKVKNILLIKKLREVFMVVN